MMRAWVGFLAVCLTLLFALRADAAPRLHTSLRPETIEVGDMATLTLSVTPGDDATQADLPMLPRGTSVVGQTISPSYQIQMGGGQVVQTMVARAIFQIRAAQSGTFTLGPPSVIVGGVKYTGDRVTLRVVARGTLPQRVDPFDPFGLFGGFDQPPQQPLEPEYPTDPRYSLERARDPGSFLHAVVDKKSSVVGEQVNLSVLVYVDMSQGEPELSDPHEPGTSEFVRESLLKNDAQLERLAFTRVGGKLYAVVLMRKYALFPLHAGDLEITPMRVHISRGERASETLTVRVSEPPLDGRPPGYRVGDVGQFTLTAEVAPRDVKNGGAISVNVELAGRGNLPASLPLPTRAGVTWLDPELHDDLHILDAKTAGAKDVWGGTRRFAFIVQPTKEGDLDLGEIALPFYDPQSKSYAVARATLGVVHVSPGVAQAAGDDAKLLPDMPALRKTLGATRAAERHWTDSSLFWGLLGMPMLAFGLAVSGRRAKQTLGERARQRKESPQTDLKQRLRAIDDLARDNDGRALDGATIRALEVATLAHFDVNVRGVGGEAVVSVLTRAGVAEDIATELRELLEECAAARFSPDGTEIDDARERAKRAKSLCDRMRSKE